jgi:hypothetical protein
MSYCSDEAEIAGEPLPGTAPRKRSWIVIEQDGSYGEHALTESRLPLDVGQRLAASKADTGTGVLLARRPEFRTERDTTSRQLWLASCGPGATRMRIAQIDDNEAFPRLDLARIGDGELPALGRISREPALFICTNGRRDTCCALKGRSLVSGLLTSGAGEADQTHIWESSHQGGHRFAPVAVLLPYGYVYGRLTPATATEVIGAAERGELALSGLRGRSSLPRTAQAAELIVRRSYSLHGAEDLDVLARNSDGRVQQLSHRADIGPELLQVRHVDGRAWNVQTRLEPVRPRTPVSCQEPPSERTAVRIARLEPAAPWC